MIFFSDSLIINKREITAWVVVKFFLLAKEIRNYSQVNISLLYLLEDAHIKNALISRGWLYNN